MKTNHTQLVSTRGPHEGVCNICGQFSTLTDDHTPPKGAVRIGKVEMLHIIHHLNGDKPVGKKRTSQNGAKYRTLCARCNNEILGHNYDPALISFVNTVGSYLRTKVTLPPTLTISAPPQKIMRSIIGHLSAQGVDRHDFGNDTQGIRNYLLDSSLPLPENVNIYYWIFPYTNQTLIRDCAYLDTPTGKSWVIWLMKFFPIAFMVTWDQPPDIEIRLPNLASWRDIPVNEEREIPVILNQRVPQLWPEAPSDHSALMYGKEALVALAK